MSRDEIANWRLGPSVLAVGGCIEAQLVTSKKADSVQQKFSQKLVLREKTVLKKKESLQCRRI